MPTASMLRIPSAPAPPTADGRGAADPNDVGDGGDRPPRPDANASVDSVVREEATASSARQAERYNTGPWTAEEHASFLRGLECHGKKWAEIASLKVASYRFLATHVESRTDVQIRSHAQQYFKRMAKANPLEVAAYAAPVPDQGPRRTSGRTPRPIVPFGVEVFPAGPRAGWTPEEDKRLSELARGYGTGQVKWTVVAAELPGREPTGCLERWTNVLDPSISWSPFTAEEDRAIARFQAGRKKAGQWDTLAKTLPGRTARQLRQRWNQVLAIDPHLQQPKNGLSSQGKGGGTVTHRSVTHEKERQRQRKKDGAANTSAKKRKQPWTAEEDEKLSKLVRGYGSGEVEWSTVATNMPGRPSMRCKERWTMVLDPSISRSPFTAAEDRAIVRLKADGEKTWVEIAENLPGRTARQLRHRWSYQLEAKVKARGSPWAKAGDRQRPRGPTSRGETLDGKPGPSPVNAAAAAPIGVSSSRAALNEIWQECCDVADRKGSESELKRKLQEFLSEAKSSGKEASCASEPEPPSKRTKRVAMTIVPNSSRDDPAVRYDCPFPGCGKTNLSKMGLSAHHGMMHGKVDWSKVRRSQVDHGTTASLATSEGSADETADKYIEVRRSQVDLETPASLFASKGPADETADKNNIELDMQQEKRDAKGDKQEGGEDVAATIKRKPWTDKEDESLRELVMWSASGTGKVKWSDVATRMPDRSIRQCQGRWKNSLDPSISRSPFTADEDRAILGLQADEGTAGKWAELAPSLPGRTGQQLRNRWMQLEAASGKAKTKTTTASEKTKTTAASEKTKTTEREAKPPSPNEPVRPSSVAPPKVIRVVASTTTPLARVEQREDGSVRYDYGERYSKNAIQARTMGDGSVFPAQQPQKKDDGTYARPAGRARAGMNWDGIRGCWVPGDQ